MLSRSEFQRLYEQGPDALFAYLEEQDGSRAGLRAALHASQEMNLTLLESYEDQQRAFNDLRARIQELESRLNKDSHNSNHPPSSDGLKKKPAPKSLRPVTGRKPGGQKGHLGNTLTLSATPDQTVKHAPVCCRGCGASLEEAQIVAEQRRQVHDLPAQRLIVTEHVAQSRRCSCGVTTTAIFPEEAKQPVGYGPRIKALSVYLQDYQFLPFDRCRQLLCDLFGASLSTGTLSAFRIEAADRLKGTTQAIRDAIIASNVAHFDETGARVGGKLHWIHSAGTEKLTSYTCHANRGKRGSDAGGVLPSFTGRAVHDAWSSYGQYDCKHALCNAHHLRELTGLCEQGEVWAKPMLELLIDIKAAVERAKQQGRSELNVLLIAEFEGRYQKLLAQGYAANPMDQHPLPDKRGRPKQTPARNLLCRLDRHRPQVLAYMYDFAVPFDNNLAERDVRMVKVRQKVSGGFRTLPGAQVFCDLRGYLSTLRKQGKKLFASLEAVFQGRPEPVTTG
jgi:transposase